jgi:hypothetical protein
MAKIFGPMIIVCVGLVIFMTSCATLFETDTDQKPQHVTTKEESSSEPAKTEERKVTNDQIQTFAHYYKYEFEFVSLPQFEEVTTVEMIFSLKESIIPSISFSDAAGKDYFQSYILEKTKDSTWKLALIFPQTGDYKVNIVGKPQESSKNKYYGMVSLSFSASVSPNKQVQILESEGRQELVFIEEARTVEEEWFPTGGLRITKFRSGYVAKELTVDLQGNSITIEKGTEIRYYGSNQKIYHIAFTPKTDIPLSIGTNSVVFEGGTEIYIGRVNCAGTIADKTQLSADYLKVTAPPSSRINFYKDKLSRIDLNGEGMLVLPEGAFPCKDYITFNPWSSDDERISFVNSQPVSLSIEKTSFICPAESSIVYKNREIDYIGFHEPVTITTENGVREIEANRVVWFAEDGSIENVGTMKGGY